MKRFRWWKCGSAAVALGLLPCACGDKKSSAKKELKEAGYEMTAEGWFHAAETDEVEAMKRFVTGGFALETRNQAGDSALHVAAGAGAKKTAEYLLGKGVPINQLGGKQRTPLMAAVLGDKPAMVKWLLKQGADPALRDEEGCKAMHLAAREGRAGCVVELVAYDRGDLDGQLLLAAFAGRAQVIDVLTSYGASVYARKDDGRTALMLAAENGHLEAVKMLLDTGASRFATAPDGRTAADMAVAAGHQEIAVLLGKEPGAAELGIDTPEAVATEMAASADARGREAGGSAKKPAGVVSIGGVTLAAADAGAAKQASVPGEKDLAGSAPAASHPAAERGPLVMRGFRQRELPLEVIHAEGGSAELKVPGGAGKTWKVTEGATIPGSRLKVVTIHRKMVSTKLNKGEPLETSVVEVEDTSNGKRRELIAGVPSSAHEPLALVEDAVSGVRYTATTGQKFRGGDGVDYVVADVRPNQIVLENTATHDTKTVPLSGPRG